MMLSCVGFGDCSFVICVEVFLVGGGSPVDLGIVLNHIILMLGRNNLLLNRLLLVRYDSCEPCATC